MIFDLKSPIKNLKFRFCLPCLALQLPEQPVEPQVRELLRWRAGGALIFRFLQDFAEGFEFREDE